MTTTNQIDDGGPAFPRDSFTDKSTGLIVQQNGMTLRDWFAGQAMSGLCAAYESGRLDDTLEGFRGGKKVSVAAYTIADAMLAARNSK